MISQPLADFLVAKGYPVSVVNPAKVKAFAQSELSRAKTDKADAKLIARYALSMQSGLWTPPPPAIRRLQALTRRIEHLLEINKWNVTAWMLLTKASLRLSTAC